jgi:hypothetical protein
LTKKENVMLSLIGLLSSAQYGYGDAPPPAESGSHIALYVALLIGGWVLSLLIAFWLIRAGVRGGVRELAELSRQQLTQLQNQSAQLSQLVRQLDGAAEAAEVPKHRSATALGSEKAAPAVTAPTGSGAVGEDAATAWEALGRR